MAIVITCTVLVWLLAPLGALAQQPESELEMRQAADADDLAGSAANWAEETPVPGGPVKFRLRGASLSRILTAPDEFELTVDGEPVAAAVVMPEPRTEPQRIELSVIAESGPEQADLVLDLDRGAQPPPIDRLELTMASRKLLAKAFVAAGDSLEALGSASEAQLVYQELKNGRLLRLATLVCDPGNARFLRIRLVGAGGTKVQGVEGWLEPELQQEAYGVAAALGSMYDGLLEGEHKWPLILQDNRLPLVKLKILADAPGETRLMTVLRESVGEDVSDAVQLTWADGLTLGSLELSSKWVELSGDSREGVPVISVEDGGEEPLQLKGVQAYASEVWLVFERPESDDVVLWLDRAGAAEEMADAAARLDLARARYGGEFNELSLARPVGRSKGEHAAGDVELLLGSSWFRILAWGSAALLLLIIGLLLLRRRAEA